MTPKSTRSPVEKILVDANIVPQHLADLFLVPVRSEKKKMSRVVTTSRVITSTEHQKLLKEKLEAQETREREQKERKDLRERKKEEKKHALASKQDDGSKKKKQKLSEEKEDEDRTMRRSSRTAKCSLSEMLQKMKDVESISEDSGSYTSEENESDYDPFNLCYICKAKYPPTCGSVAERSKVSNSDPTVVSSNPALGHQC